MKISELSAKTGVSPRSLRYYEQQGLFEAVRLPNGYRDYDAEVMSTVLTVRSLLDLGFPMDLIRTVLPCTTGENKDQVVCEGVTERVRQIRDEMAERVVHLERTRDTLTGFLAGREAG
ncbi:MerR family transcriptional regulator [Kineosporia sp. J2-2]|uniref:MerR family transcriptional regulator n=1 Tax=Kineosporia corallincola TaxID=2835133 RepID=A0ABS5TNQ6_9ACTN|nr:MerR family transcriptional regulator [Kineosporia corallincola]MBT0771219.1 MerR family transcriptional regulator [Kineosporia corallincola]